MSQKTTKAVAKFIAILLVGALVITSFSFVFSWAEPQEAVYYGVDERLNWENELLKMRDFIIKTKAGYKDDVTYKSLIDGAYKGVIDSLNDPYSIFYSTEDESQEFIESVSGEFFGIGVSLEQVGGACKVVSPIAGGPAEKAGILSGDVITKVDDKNVGDMALVQITELLRGKEGTSVNVTVMRDGKILTFPLVREKIRMSSVTHELLEGGIGYIKISQFDSDSHLEFKEAKLKLIAAGAKSFIVDVRNNPGGYVGTAASIAEQMMPAGPIVHFANKDKIVETITANGQGDRRFPIVLLVNEGSASASEILAAAWKDSGSATLVGTGTYGKGVAQQILPVDDESQVKLSMYYFVSPKKDPIAKVGVIPDYVVKNYMQQPGWDASKFYDEYKRFAPMSEKNKPRQGDTGLNVFGAQQRLQMLGYKVEANGRMDKYTVDSVRSFQNEHGLYPYGVLDYSTMAMIDKTTLDYVNGAKNNRDLQLEKAVELLAR